jgi:hypothetical protein
MLHKTNSTIGVMFMVTRDDWALSVQFAKQQCTCATNGLIKELERRFPAHELMNAMGIIYPHYWEVFDVETTFPSLLAILKAKFCHPKPIGASGTLVASLLDPTFLNQQMSFLCLTMKNNSHGTLHLLLDCNPITKFWG